MSTLSVSAVVVVVEMWLLIASLFAWHTCSPQPGEAGKAFPRRRTSFAQLPLIAQRVRGGAQQFANELGGPRLSAVEQNTTNSAEDSLQVSRAPRLD